MINRIRLFSFIIITSLIATIFLYIWHYKLTSALSNAKGNLNTVSRQLPAELKRREYGYTDITDLFYKFPNIKVTGLKRSPDNLALDLELMGSNDNFEDFVKYLWEKENFLGITRLAMSQRETGENCFFMKLEFLISN